MDQEQQTASAPRRARRRPVMPIVGILAVGLLVAAGIAYLAGGFTDRDRFEVEPPACASIEPSVHLLGFAYATRQTEDNSCRRLSLPSAIPDMDRTGPPI